MYHRKNRHPASKDIFLTAHLPYRRQMTTDSLCA